MTTRSFKGKFCGHSSMCEVLRWERAEGKRPCLWSTVSGGPEPGYVGLCKKNGSGPWNLSDVR